MNVEVIKTNIDNYCYFIKPEDKMKCILIDPGEWNTLEGYLDLKFKRNERI